MTANDDAIRRAPTLVCCAAAPLGLTLLFTVAALGCSKLRHASESDRTNSNATPTTSRETTPAAEPPSDTLAAVDDEPQVLLQSLSQTTGSVSFVTDDTDLYFEDNGFVYRGDFDNGPQKLGGAPGNLAAIDRTSFYFDSTDWDEPTAKPSLIRLDRKSWKELWRVAIPTCCMRPNVVRGFIGCAFWLLEEGRGSVDLYSLRSGKHRHLADTGPAPALGGRGDTVCWTSPGRSQIRCENLATGVLKTFSGTPASVWGLALTGKTLVYTSKEHIGAVDLTTGKTRVLANHGANALVVDRTHAYMLLDEPPSPYGGEFAFTLARVPLHGGPLEEMFDGLTQLYLALTKTDIYVQVNDRLHSFQIIRGPKEPDGPGPIRPGDDVAPYGSEPKRGTHHHKPVLPDAEPTDETPQAA